MHKGIAIIIIAMAGIAATGLSLAADNQHHQQPGYQKLIITRQTIPSLLDWQPSNNACGGNFIEPAAITDNPHPLPYNQELTTITAKKSADLSQIGTSTLTGDVTVTQTGRSLRGDRAILYRDANTKKINRIELFGHIQYREAGRLLVGDHAVLDLTDNKLTLDRGLYHFTQPWYWRSNLNTWGSYQKIVRNSPTLYNFSDASYSSCAPTSRAWQFSAKHLTIDKTKNKGTIKSAWMKVHSIPIFYMPYWTFPLTPERKTGFLFPTFASTNENGFDVSLPFYLNLAKNYDLLLTSRYMTKRGILNSGLFRYLTYHSLGFLYLSYIPMDKAFQQFRENANTTINPDLPYAQSYIDALNNDHNYRGLIEFNNITHFNKNWKLALTGNYVSDDYYFEDFGSNPYTIDTDQLLNQANLSYNSEHWHFLASAQAYQTLQTVNQPIAGQQYARLPEFDLGADYPNERWGIDYGFSSQYVRFDHQKLFGSHFSVPKGNRVNINPKISWPVLRAGGFFIPELQADVTQYDLRDNTAYNPANPEHITRILPIFDIDSGLYFDKKISLFGHEYTQTLEPRIYYDYIPYTNQNDIPLFDTSLPSFNYDQLFRPNRFVGTDRIGDANRISFGITSSLLNGYTGAQQFSISLGEGYYFNRPKVTSCVTANCSNVPTIPQLTPMAGTLTYNLTRFWSASASAAWEWQHEKLNNAGFSLNYVPSGRKTFTIGYNFIEQGDPYTSIEPDIDPDSSRNNYNRAYIGAAWPLYHHWSLVGNFNYNISHEHPEAYFYGLQYNGCCFAIRAINSRSLTSEQENGIPNNLHYSNSYFLQIQFKGLGNFGTNAASGLLRTGIPGFQDPFLPRT